LFEVSMSSHLLVTLFCVFAVALHYACGSVIVNGAPWFDDTGKRIEAHGLGLLKDPASGKYYWYGESYKASAASTHGINCYSSTDLVHWHFERESLLNQDIKVSQPGPYVVERPKVVYNANTKKYVMWFHLDSSSYSLRNVGVAVADAPTDHFTFVRGFKPDNAGSLDMGLYADDDGSVYLIRSVENSYVGISKLTNDYLDSAGMVSKIDQAREGPAIFKMNGTYYLVSSHLTGWAPNAMDAFKTGKSLNGAVWTSIGNPTGSGDSFDSQSTFVLSYTQPDGHQMIVYQGDRWNEAGPGGLGNATYIWLPITAQADGSFKVNWVSSWDLKA